MKQLIAMLINFLCVYISLKSNEPALSIAKRLSKNAGLLAYFKISDIFVDQSLLSDSSYL
ncbi:hypothetical protein T08_4022 [Trichinella sp. T8]|nr:hypothetical protein T08_4022 [Trichinella sp. T8]